jgi:hypothetical protein
MKKIATLVFLLFAVSICSVAQQAVPAIKWSKCFGGFYTDVGNSIAQTTDGNFVIVGNTGSNDGDVVGNNEYLKGGKAWVIKINNEGRLLWQKTYGGTGGVSGRFITATSDGGSIFTAWSISKNGQTSGNHGGEDVWVAKLDANGNLQWQRSYGGSGVDEAKLFVLLPMVVIFL